MGPGVDPHLYKASESDVRRSAEADLILYNGLHLEGKMGDILVKMARSRPVVRGHRGRSREPLLREPPEFLGQYDPHVWFDVSHVGADRGAGRATRSRELDPAHAADVRSATPRRSTSELDELDALGRGADRDRPGAAARPGHRPRRLRLLRPALRHRGRRPAGHQHRWPRPASRTSSRRRRPASSAARSRRSSSSRACRGARSRPCSRRVRGARAPRSAIGGQLFSDAMGAAGRPAGHLRRHGARQRATRS